MESQRINAHFRVLVATLSPSPPHHQVSAWISRGAVPTAVRATAQCVEWLMQYSAHVAATAAVAASWSRPLPRGAVHLPSPSSSSSAPPPSAAASHASAQMLRMSGAMCLQRLVNGLVDPLQKRAHAMSVASLARLLQLPPSFVELRHEAAHGPELPTLAVIQSSCTRAVAWLRQQYWRPQVGALRARIPLLAQCLRIHDDCPCLT